MAQKTSWTGAALTESDINTYLMGEGGAWTSWTPSVVQSGAVTTTNTRSTYARFGRLIIATFQLAVTGSGSGSNAITVSLPVTAATSSQLAAGGIRLDDSSASTKYHALPLISTTTTIQLVSTSTDGTATSLGAASTPFTSGLASGDSLTGTVIYEAAS